MDFSESGRKQSKLTAVRDETLSIKLRFNASSLTKGERLFVLQTLEPWLSGIKPENFFPGDTIDFKGRIEINYFGDVLSMLRGILLVIDKAEVIDVNTKELQHGHSIIQEVIVKLDQFEKKFKERKKGG